MDQKDLRALTLVGPTQDDPVPDPLAAPHPKTDYISDLGRWMAIKTI